MQEDYEERLQDIETKLEEYKTHTDDLKNTFIQSLMPAQTPTEPATNTTTKKKKKNES